jgi:acetylornithine deacetylase/succinyl-diaminopimelate desuccinylase-like protein
LALTLQQEGHFRRAAARVQEQALIDAVRELIDIPSATGDEGPLARAIVRRLNQSGLDGVEQALDTQQSNAFGTIRGSGGGPSLLLYSPIDTVTSNDPAEDLPAAGEYGPDLQAHSLMEDRCVVGLGAQNPKGHAACVLLAAEAIQAAGIPLKGDLYAGFGAGGMPTNARAGTRAGSGHGAGCASLAGRLKPDYAVIAKTGWAVSWEEVGLVWYEVRVHGTHTYVGSRQLLPYVNPIQRAGLVIEALEAWFAEWSEEHRSGLVAPQGAVSFIEAGWERSATFVPAVCRFRFDLRISPRTSVESADLAVERQLSELARRFDLKMDWQRLIAIPGTTTAPDNLIIVKCIEAWEAIEGRTHAPIAGLSGATDANILRGLGVPTARVGLPKADLPGLDFRRGMNTVSIPSMVKLTRHLIHTAIATCAE